MSATQFPVAEPPELISIPAVVAAAIRRVTALVVGLVCDSVLDALSVAGVVPPTPHAARLEANSKNATVRTCEFKPNTSGQSRTYNANAAEPRNSPADQAILD